MTGLVPAATLRVTNAYNTQRGYDLANSILTAANALRAGDVMLLEQQVAGPLGSCQADQVGCVAVEWVPAYYDAIVSATSRGIIVVEAAGNGQQNLDNPAYGPAFPADAPTAARSSSARGAQATAALRRAPSCGSPTTAAGSTSRAGRVRHDNRVWQPVCRHGSQPVVHGQLRRNVERLPIVASAAASLSSVAKSRGSP